VALGLFQTGQFALDIGGSTVVALSVAGRPENLRLRACHEWSLSPGLVVDGEIVEHDLFIRELRSWVNQHKLRGRSVHLAVGNQKVIVRTIDMPDLPEEELLSAIQFQAQEYIPIPVDEVVLDSMILGRRVAPDGSVRQQVLLVAAQKTMIMNLLSAVRKAGLKVLGIDVASLALLRALVPDDPFVTDAAGQAACHGLVDVSSSVSTLAVATEGVLKFTRIINFSSDRFSRSLAESLEVPLEDAHALVRRVGLAGPLPPDRDFYRDEVVDATQVGLSTVATELGEEIRRSFDYYQAQEHAVPVGQLILSGRGALVRNLDAHLANLLDMPVALANPLAHIAQNSSGVPDADLASMAPCLSVAVGLVLPERN
jgi:type IV pilus assembly protein PilM